MASKINTVILNGVTYYIRGPVIAQPVSDFAANIRIGEETYDARQGAGYSVFEDFSGGPGLLRGKSREDLARYALTTGLDTRIGGQMTLPLLATAGTGLGGGAGNVFARRRHTAMHYEVMGGAVRVVFASGQNLYSTGCDLAAWADEGVMVAGKKIEDIEQYLPVEGILGEAGVPYIYATCQDLTVQPNNKGCGRFWATGGGASFTKMPDSIPSRTLIAYDNKLLIQMAGAGTFTLPGGGIARTGHVYVTLDGATLVKDSGGINPDPVFNLPNASIGRFLGPAPAPWGELAPYYIANKLYVLDFYARRYYAVPIDMSDIRAGCCWQDGLVLTDGLHIVHYAPGDPGVARPIDIVRDQGFMSDQVWAVDALWGEIGGYLYAQLSNGAKDKMWMWEYRGAVWHPIGIAQAGVPAGMLITDKSHSNWGLDVPQKRFWQFSQTPTGFYIDHPAGSDNPLVGTAAFDTTAAGWKIETPWLDCGFKELIGGAFQLWSAGQYPTNCSCEVWYAVDGSTTFYNLGNFGSASGTHFNFNHNAAGSVAGTVTAGQVFTTIKFRFILKSTTSTVSPQPLPMTLVFRKKPGLRMAYLFTVDVARCIAENVGTFPNFVTLHNLLKGLWNTKSLVSFSYADITATKVDVVSMPTREQELVGARRRGAITVQTMEPIDF